MKFYIKRTAALLNNSNCLAPSWVELPPVFADPKLIESFISMVLPNHQKIPCIKAIRWIVKTLNPEAELSLLQAKLLVEYCQASIEDRIRLFKIDETVLRMTMVDSEISDSPIPVPYSLKDGIEELVKIQSTMAKCGDNHGFSFDPYWVTFIRDYLNVPVELARSIFRSLREEGIVYELV